MAAAFTGRGGLHPSTFPLDLARGRSGAARRRSPCWPSRAASRGRRRARMSDHAAAVRGRRGSAIPRHVARRARRRHARHRRGHVRAGGGADRRRQVDVVAGRSNGLVPHFTGGTVPRPGDGGRSRHAGVPAAQARRRRGVRAAGSRRLVRARSRRGRARVRHGEPGRRPGAHAPARGGDARPAGHRAAARAERPNAVAAANDSASRSRRRWRRGRGSWCSTSPRPSSIRRPPSTSWRRCSAWCTTRA